jgi:hypothetical protein
MPTAPAPGFAALGLRQPEDLKRMGANTAFVLNGYPGLALSRLRQNVRDGSKAERLKPSKYFPVYPQERTFIGGAASAAQSMDRLSGKVRGSKVDDLTRSMKSTQRQSGRNER